MQEVQPPSILVAEPMSMLYVMSQQAAVDCKMTIDCMIYY
jgi:hypothetical protein